MKKIIYSGLSVVFLLLTFVSSATAKLDVNASVGLREEYNDNIFLTKTNREDDFITSISPNISLNYALSYLDLSLDYGLNFKFFAHHSELNLTSLTNTQAASLEHQFRPMKGMFIDISDVYRRVPVDIRNQVAFDNVFVNMTDSNIFSVSPNFVYPLSSTLETRFGYRYTNIWYKVREGNNSESNSAFISILKKLSPSLSTGVNYNFVAVQPKKTEAYDQHQGSVNVMYQRGSDFKVWGEFGRVFINYESDRKIETNFWDVGSDYSLKISENTSLGAGYSTSFAETDITGEVRQLRFRSYYYDPKNPTVIWLLDPYYTYDRYSVSAGATKEERVDIFFRTGQRFRISVNPYYTVVKYLEIDRKDKITGIAANFYHKLSAKINSSIHGVAEKQKFLPENREYSRYSIGLNLDYRLSKHITTGLGYTYNTRKSNNADEFHNNIAWIQSTFSF